MSEPSYAACTTLTSPLASRDVLKTLASEMAARDAVWVLHADGKDVTFPRHVPELASLRFDDDDVAVLEFRSPGGPPEGSMLVVPDDANLKMN